MEFDPETTMVELIEAARKQWALANIGKTETLTEFALRIGVSYRTTLRWFGKLSTTDKIIRRALDPLPKQPFDISVLPRPIVWSSEHIQSFYGPMVYVVMKDSEAVYVGSTKNGIVRLSNHDHRDVIGNATRILFYSCPDYHDAKRLESQLIRQYRPLFNVNQT